MESRRSFASRMNPCELSAERGCYIFAMINIVFISTCLLACMYYVKWARDHLSDGGIFGIHSGFEFLFSLLLAFMVTISFAFAMVLCFGVHKNRPSYIHAYFIYGFIEKMIAYLLLVVTYISYISTTMNNWVIAVFVINVIYSLLLIVVYRAHRAMSAEAKDTYKTMEDVPLA